MVLGGDPLSGYGFDFVVNILESCGVKASIVDKFSFGEVCSLSSGDFMLLEIFCVVLHVGFDVVGENVL